MKTIRMVLLFTVALAPLIGVMGDGAEREWLQQSEALLSDSSLVRRYRFAGVHDGGGIVRNLMETGGDLRFVPGPDGADAEGAPRVVPGRSAGNRAVQLDRGCYQGAAVDFPSNQFSVMGWFRVHPGTKGKQMGTMLATGGWTRGWRIVGIDPLAVSIGTRDGCATVRANAHLPQGLWHHLAGVWDGATIMLFVNGERIAAAEHAAAYIPATPTDLFTVGHDRDGGMEPLPFDIDEICIFDRALSAEQIAVLSKRETDLTDSILRSADRHVGAGEWEQARAEYRKLATIGSLEHARELSLFHIAESYRLAKDYAGAHNTYGEILALPDVTAGYRAYALFRQAEVYAEQQRFDAARETYRGILAVEGVTEHHRFLAELAIGDTHVSERKHTTARDIFKRLLKAQQTASYPHEGYRLDLTERLETIEGLADGREPPDRRQARAEWVGRPRLRLHVSTQGSDDGAGTEDKPFATIVRARQEVRRIKREQGLPEGGIAVWIRGGKYFIAETIVFGEEDSGSEAGPVVYRNYPGEEARIIGGREVPASKVVDDPAILARLPEEARGKVRVADLRAAGITDYGHLRNRGAHGTCNPGAMELFHNTRPFRLARWPKDGWVRVADLVDPEGDENVRGIRVQKGKFRYAGERPKRWTDETDIWAAGYFMRPWNKLHTKVLSIDADEKIVYLAPDIRWAESYALYSMPVQKGRPHFFYNLLGELSAPGEFYIDRSAGQAYFLLPDSADPQQDELIVSTLDAPLFKLDKVSNLALVGLTLECTWRDAVHVKNCSDTLIARCTIRNTGNAAVIIDGGWRNTVVGCDIYDTGEGGISLSGGDWEKLVPGGHLVENNHIYRFNRFSHGSSRFAVRLQGVGNRLRHNVIHDASYIAVIFDGNDHVIEYNEIYDVMNEARDGGAIYTYGEPRYLMNRGNVMRYNFLHHITEHSSPLPTHQVTGIYIDAFNAGMTMLGNVLYRHTERAMFTHGPDTRIENNLFVDNHIAITQSNRTYLLRPPDRAKRWEENILKKVKHRQPPWSSRYPQVVTILEEMPLGAPKRIVVQRNVVTGGPLLRVSGDFDDQDNAIESNWDGGRVFFHDVDALDFRIRPGSPVFGVVGYTPVPFDRIGLYRDSLRASWPVQRICGKYYKPGKRSEATGSTDAKFPPLLRVRKVRNHQVPRRTAPIRIDGVPTPEEWGGLDRDHAMVMDQEHRTGTLSETALSYAWLRYDDQYLYVCTEHSPDPWREGLPEHMTSVVHELAVEGAIGPATWWWEEGLPTGPLYVLSGRPNGTFTVHNLFNMPPGVIDELEKAIEYKARTIDPETYHWTAEWKIPLAQINLDPSTARKVKFNIGGPKRAGWFCWVATGSSLWRVDNAGTIEFGEQEQ